MFVCSGDKESHKILGLFFGFVGLMQLYDWIFWDNNTRNKVNFVFTKIAMITNHLQPIVLGSLILMYKGELPFISRLFFASYTVSALLYSAIIYNRIDYTVTGFMHKIYRSVPAESQTLLDGAERGVEVTEDGLEIVDNIPQAPREDLLFWQWNYQKYSQIFYALFLSTFSVLVYQSFETPLNYALVAINILSFVMASFKDHYVGERWCEFACYVPLFLMLINIDKK
jgi:hypothetical protein